MPDIFITYNFEELFVFVMLNSHNAMSDFNVNLKLIYGLNYLNFNARFAHNMALTSHGSSFKISAMLHE